MEYLLLVKVCALVGLLALTLFFGMLPARLQWFRNSSGTESHRIILAFVSCFAGGVFLSACLLDIIPDYLSDIGAQLEARAVDTDFPIAEFIMASGFFLVLILERFILDYTGRRSGEATPLLLPSSHSHGHHSHLESGEHHVHVDVHAHSSFRSFMLFLSLSFHSVFEGLAIGLQTTDSKVLEICIAILIHKSIIVFSLSLKLVQSAVPQLWLMAYLLVFSMMSPLGIFIGILVTEAHIKAGLLVQAILEGIAAGTFIYITFLEILPHELNNTDQPLLKVLFILLGFTLMAGISFIG
ncbi:zinc transporter ZIP1 [Polypterus senegalus]|uniref:zinc transporter ZIP1 n=1 Tax=Polypterus senegalus TaxID=55291 RepID=UPI001964B773|nr:zinc transporter ZIP1 [Polypterus senegalus]